MMGVKGTRKLRLICLAEDQGTRGHFEVEMGNCRLMPLPLQVQGLGKSSVELELSTYGGRYSLSLIHI